MSLVFVLIEGMARFDRAFLVFGIANFSLALFCAIDIWLQPYGHVLHWIRIQHLIASFFPALLMWHLMLVVGKPNMNLVRVLFLAGIVFAVVFLGEAMLIESLGEKVTITPIYYTFFAPFMLTSIIGIVAFMIWNIGKVGHSRRVLLIQHLVGVGAVALGGTLDLLSLLAGRRLASQTGNNTLYGALVFGMIMTIVFTRRLTAIIRDREVTFLKLKGAYRELEEARALRELGQSSAIINHEIRNYTCAVSGYAALALRDKTLSEKTRMLVSKVNEGMDKILGFSQDILDFSKSRILRDMKPLSIISLINRCVKNFRETSNKEITVHGYSDPKIMIAGDWTKLEQVFLNLFRNAFEADAKSVAVRVSCTETVLLVTVEDDGKGCCEEEISKIFKAFYTSKKETGTGLGMAIVQSTIEGHGGAITAHTKNLAMEEKHGLVINLTFPLYKEAQREEQERYPNILLIGEGIKGLPDVIKLFRNVHSYPKIASKLEDVEEKLLGTEHQSVIGTVETLNQLRKRTREYTYATHAFLPANGSTLLIIDETSENPLPEVFSEDYIVSHLLNPGNSGDLQAESIYTEQRGST